jgi:hypothetical protein
VCVLVEIGVVAFWPGEREPENNRKKLTEWLIYRGTAKSEDQVQVPEDAVRHIGTMDARFGCVRPDRFIEKPFTAEEFLQEVEAAIGV